MFINTLNNGYIEILHALFVYSINMFSIRFLKALFDKDILYFYYLTTKGLITRGFESDCLSYGPVGFHCPTSDQCSVRRCLCEVCAKFVSFPHSILHPLQIHRTKHTERTVVLHPLWFSLSH